MSTSKFPQETSSTTNDAGHISILNEQFNHHTVSMEPGEVVHAKLHMQKIQSTNPKTDEAQEKNSNEPIQDESPKQLVTQTKPKNIKNEEKEAEMKDGLVLSLTGTPQIDKETENNQNTYSILPKSNNVLDSPASRYLIREFEKIVVKEIIEKNKQEMNKVSHKNVTDTETAITSSAKQKLKIKSLTVFAENDGTLTPTKSQGDETEVVEPPKLLAKGEVPCRYAHSGCKEILERGTMYELDHYQNCKYRPLQCILGPACTEILPYHDYIPHLTQHFLVPTYATEITSSVILSPDDFSKNQHWAPKWFSGHHFHFFANVSRTVNGTWTAWVWMLGSPEEADEFAARITFVKGVKCVSEIFPVHSIRVSQEAIEAEKTCLLVTDETMQELSLLGKNFFAEFSLNVRLIPHAKQLNITTRELTVRSFTHSRPLKSEKLYVTTIDAADTS